MTMRRLRRGQGYRFRQVRVGRFQKGSADERIGPALLDLARQIVDALVGLLHAAAVGKEDDAGGAMVSAHAGVP